MSCSVIVPYVLLVALFGAVAGQGIFSPMDPAQVDKLLSDSQYVQKQIACVLGKGTCDHTGRQLRVAIPEVLVRQCRSCSPKQKENAQRVVTFIQDNYPNEWSQILAKYQKRFQ